MQSPKGARGGGAEFAFQVVSSEDPNFALAGLRIEIERRLNSIAESHSVLVRNAGAGRMLSILEKNQILAPREASALRDVVGLLSSAVHGAEVDPKAFLWAMEIGPNLLFVLDEKIAEE